MRHFILICIAFLINSCAVNLLKFSELKSLSFSHNNIETQAFVANTFKPNASDTVFIILHEAWKHKALATKKAKSLAEKGYTTMTLDIYANHVKANSPKGASKYAQKILNHNSYIRDLYKSAQAALVKELQRPIKKIVVIGFSFGADVALEIAKRDYGPNLVVSFYSHYSSSTPILAKKIHSSLLLFNGKEDIISNKIKQKEFAQKMVRAEAEVLLINYPGAKHEFNNPLANKLAKEFKLPMAYNKNADLDSWQKMLMYLKTKNL